MGITAGIHFNAIKDDERGEIVKCVSEKKYKKFPTKRKKAMMSLLLEFMAFPMKECKKFTFDFSFHYYKNSISVMHIE